MPSPVNAVSSGARQRSSGGCDDRDVSRARVASDELEDLLAHELEHAARARRLEKAHGSLEGRSGRVAVDEQPALEMRERGPHVALGRGGELLDAPRGLLGQRRRRPLERGERQAPGLVRERDGDVGAGREPLDERPLRRGEILESVGVHGTAVPRGEIAGHAVRRVAPLAIAVPTLEPVELVAIRAQQIGELRLEVLGLDKPRLELRERGSQCLRVAGEARCVPRDTSQQQPALGVRKHRAVVAVAAGDAGEQVVERAHGAADERLPAGDEIALHALNLRPVRDDEHRLARDVRRIAVEQEGDLAGVRGPREQCQRHATQSRAETCRLM